MNKTINVTGQLDTPLQVLKHPINNSSAKYHWSFSKSQRFSPSKTNTNTISYDIPTTKSQRKCSFGYGNRSKFLDGKNDTPSPGQYQKQKKIQLKGHSFGYNRDQLIFANYLNTQQKTPAPYLVNDSLVKSTKAYSLRSKTHYPKNYFLPNQQDFKKIKELPGPGKYQSIDMIGSGKDFYNSKFKTQRQKTFQGSDRFSVQKKTPGPGQYDYYKTTTPDGLCVLSTMKSTGRRTILNEKRKTYFQNGNDNPAPGQYVKPSDFGHYGRPQGGRSRPQTAR